MAIQSVAHAADLKRAKRVRRPQREAALDRLPPHSMEAEVGVLSCCLISPASIDECAQRLKSRTDAFYDLRHQTIFEALMAMRRAGRGIDVITLQQWLKDEALLAQCGGYAYLQPLPDAVPSIANLSYYLEIVCEKYRLRKMIRVCTDVVSRVYDFEGDLDELMGTVRRDLEVVFEPELDAGCETIRFNDAVNFDTSNDPNNIIGVRDGRTTRFLCKGHSAWLIGPSGVGKSSLLMLIAVSCCLGRPFFGVAPQRKLRVILVQAENDMGDLSEMLKGIAEGMGLDFDEEAQELLQNNFVVKTATGKLGEDFCHWLEREIIEFKADVVFVDPLLSFAGIDVGRQEQASMLCRLWLDPILKRTGAVLISNHHTGKPERNNGKPKAPQSIYELMYSGIGSSELVNWARAVLILQPTADGENAFRLTFAKRGKRAWALQPNGDFTMVVWLRHAEKSIYWEQMEPPVEPEPSERKGGKPSDKERVAAMNLFGFCDACSVDGEGLNVIAKRLESWLAKQGEDVSLTTCKRTIPLLVKNGKLSKGDDSQYRKGQNA